MRLLHAHTVYPVDDEPIRDGGVLIDKEHIIALGDRDQLRQAYPQAEFVDLGDSVLLPGLINAHTHLELSHLKGQIPYRGDFVDWIDRLILARQPSEWLHEDFINAACRESIAAGTTTVADISHQHRCWRILARQPLRKICFAEVIDITADWPKSVFYLERCVSDRSNHPLLSLGLSPHAPYSVTPELYTLTARKAARHHLPLTTHLAETEAEIEFLQSGAGPWRTFLERIGKWDGYFTCPHTTPVDYFLRLDLAHQPFLLAHVNYISNEELDELAQTNHSVVFCPRAHHFFQHPPHRFMEMLAAGITVCLGTDSLASNDSVSILDEMRFIHHSHENVSADTILKMATLNGAIVLQQQDQIGSITPNKLADLTAIPLIGSNPDPLVDIFCSHHQPRLTLIHGRQVHPGES